MTLLVTDAAQIAGIGNLYKPTAYGNQPTAQGMVNVHPALRKMADIVIFFSGGAYTVTQIIDFAHGIVPALPGGFSRLFRKHKILQVSGLRISLK
jgi:hypothetical protein